MKKSILILSILLGLMAFSCKKDYTCDCSGSGGNTVTYDNLSKESAEEFKQACEAGGCVWSAD